MKNNLHQYANNKYSQNGEDGIIEKIVSLLPPSEKWCVEFGAWDGKYLSNTYELIANQQWNGVLIEGNPKKFPDLQATHGSNKKAVLINAFISFDGENTLDAILAKTTIPQDFDLLSIDIDGNDYHVWESLTHYAPRLVVIEFNPSIPNDIEFVQERSPRINHGNSLLSLIKLGKQKGYELIATTACNGFFVRKDFFHLFEIEDNSIASMWDSPDAPRVFQLFDGTLVLSRDFNMIWQDRKVNQYDLQIFPKSIRHFSDSKNAKGLLTKIIRKMYFKFVR
jgi:hypothetical protein